MLVRRHLMLIRFLTGVGAGLTVNLAFIVLARVVMAGLSGVALRRGVIGSLFIGEFAVYGFGVRHG